MGEGELSLLRRVHCREERAPVRIEGAARKCKPRTRLGDIFAGEPDAVGRQNLIRAENGAILSRHCANSEPALDQELFSGARRFS